MARLAGIPRATWQHLESGAGNPTLSVLTRVAAALSVTIEELVSAPRGSARHFRAAELPRRQRGQALVRRLLPDHVPGTDLERFELAPGGRMVGSPHTPGTTEYLVCETGPLTLVASGEQTALATGDVVVFRGDQKHTYLNPGSGVAVGTSVILLANPTSSATGPRRR